MNAGDVTVPILIRPAHAEDRDWILPLSARLHDFGPPPWRRRPQMDAAVARAIGQVLDSPGQDTATFVASGAEGRGVGRALMAAGEGWSRARGHRLLTLNVFGENTRARELYGRLGFAADTTKLVKVLVS